MANQLPIVFKQPFDQFVQNQILLRERIHGKGLTGYSGGSERSMDELTYLHGNTGWVRLMSCVDILNIEKQLIPSGSNREIYNIPQVVDAIETTMRGLSTGPRGIQELAYKYMLFSGVQSKEQENPRATLDLDEYNEGSQNNPNWGNNSYGLGSRVQGFKPMPGITSANIRDFNNGALREATIKIKAFDIEQLQILELLYMRIGFSMFLEWGHTVYPSGVARNDAYIIKTVGVDNDPSLRSVIFPPTQETPLVFSEILEKIQQQRQAYEGNYDAFLGRITNFNWNYNQADESYDIELKMVTMGSVIESLNMNTGFGIPAEHKGSINQIDEDGRITDAEIAGSALDSTAQEKINQKRAQTLEEKYWQFSQRSLLGFFLWLGRQHTMPAAAKRETGYFGTRVKHGGDNGLPNGRLLTGYGYYNSLQQIASSSYAPYFLYQNNSTGFSEFADIPTFMSMPHQYKGQGIPNSLVDMANIDEWITYIRFGDLLQWLERYNNETISTKTKDGIVVPDYIVNIHYDVKSDINKMYVYTPYLFSADPSICVINSEFDVRRDDENISDKEREDFKYKFKPIEPFAKYRYYMLGADFHDGYNYGYTMNIYLNIAFLMECVENCINEYEYGMVSVYNFLAKVCNGINESLGHVCHLFPWIDNNTSTLYIVNEFDNKDTEDGNDTSTINTGGYIKRNDVDPPDDKGNKRGKILAGAVRDLKITTGLSKNIQNTIAIGAAAQGVSLGQEAVSFLTWHRGLQDRVISQLAQSGETEASEERRATKEAERIKGVVDAMSQIAYDMATLNGFRYDSTYATFVEGKSYQIFNKDLFQTAKTILKDYIYITSGYLAKSKEQPTSYNGFLPINISLTLDGISGIKIFQRFRVLSRMIPARYPTLFSTIVRNIEHNISDNTWTTTIDTFVIYNNTFNSAKLKYVNENIRKIPFELVVYEFINADGTLVRITVDLRLSQPNGRENQGLVVAPPNNLAAAQNIQKIISAMKLNGFTKEETAGIMGNMQIESGFNPQAVQRGAKHPGYGLVQWTPIGILGTVDPSNDAVDGGQGKGKARDVIYDRATGTYKSYTSYSGGRFETHTAIYLLFNLQRYKGGYNTIETQVAFLASILTGRIKDEVRSSGIPYKEPSFRDTWNTIRKRPGYGESNEEYVKIIARKFLQYYERGAPSTSTQRANAAASIYRKILDGTYIW